MGSLRERSFLSSEPNNTSQEKQQHADICNENENDGNHPANNKRDNHNNNIQHVHTNINNVHLYLYYHDVTLL